MDYVKPLIGTPLILVGGHARRIKLRMFSLKVAEEAMVRRGKIAEGLMLRKRPELIDLLYLKLSTLLNFITSQS